MASDDDRPDSRDELEDVMSAPGPPSVRKDRREHGGWSERLVDDDALAERTEEERVEAGLAAYDPDDLPPATDDPVPTDFSEDELTHEIEGEIDREAGEGERPAKGDEFPPSHYSRE
jgi:hypothetical protein